MKSFAGKIAVVTGGGTGMGRELVRQLATEGCSVAMCDVLPANMAETKRLCEAEQLPQGTRITAHVADVSDEAQLIRFRDEITRQLQTDHIHLLFNNAGVAGGGSLFTESREMWERTFNICWGGIYYGVRTFLPLLQRAPDAHIINTSSINGLWASIGVNVPHTAYSAAKFAVRGFTEALMTDLRVNAPHIKCSVVFPGHVATEIIANTRKIREGVETSQLTDRELAHLRDYLLAKGDIGPARLTDTFLQKMNDDLERRSMELAPTTAAAAAKIILDGVRDDRWRILVGEDAVLLDEHVRADPENSYTDTFVEAYGPAIMRAMKPYLDA